VRVLIDYRPALREPSGVGEYAHHLVRALLALSQNGALPRPLELSLFSSSWKDRLVTPPDIAGAAHVDRRVPVSLLNFAWHRLGWPPADALARGAFDVAHSLHPLLMPARAAAQVITIHDLNFLMHPERTHAEIRRDYAPLAGDHARRADGIIVVSRFTAAEAERHFGIPADRLAVCSPGAPDWQPRSTAPADGYVLFFGTLEPRKNVGGLLDAFERIVERRRERGTPIPQLVIAGKATDRAQPWLERMRRPPLAGHVRHIGYVQPADRVSLYEQARVLVQPSFEEGFGMPVLEAMTVGVPVVASNRGALPEVVGDAGVLIDPDDPEGLAAAIERVIDDPGFAAAASARGIARARQFSWAGTARRVYEAYEQAIEHRRCASA
jgi:glycosyltransferase involved in cell wall biosynthesis